MTKNIETQEQPSASAYEGHIMEESFHLTEVPTISMHFPIAVYVVEVKQRSIYIKEKVTSYSQSTASCYAILPPLYDLFQDKTLTGKNENSTGRYNHLMHKDM